MFQSNTTRVDNSCFRTTPYPAYMAGMYLFASIGQMELGGFRFQDVLDGFGKIHRFDMAPDTDQICFSTKMMDTGFYNESMAQGKVAAGVLFKETIPPRKCLLPVCNILAPNDNVVINTVSIGADYMMVTDSPTTLNFDPARLHMTGVHKWDDHFVKWGNKGMLGSGHPLRWPGDAQNRLLNIVVEAPYVGGGASLVDIVAVSDDEPNKRELINRYKAPKGYTPYFHSFGALVC